jgi:hypothetical protein
MEGVKHIPLARSEKTLIYPVGDGNQPDNPLIYLPVTQLYFRVMPAGQRYPAAESRLGKPQRRANRFYPVIDGLAPVSVIFRHTTKLADKNAGYK